MPTDALHALEEIDRMTDLITNLRTRYTTTINDKPRPLGQRRITKRWLPTSGVSVAVYTTQWNPLSVIDIGLGGCKVEFSECLANCGPVALMLGTNKLKSLIVFGDVVWRSSSSVGIQFSFDDDEDEGIWAEQLIEDLLSKLTI